MSEQPTPETDAFEDSDGAILAKQECFDFMRSLERRLAEAEERLADPMYVYAELTALQSAHDKALAELADMTADYLRRHKDVGDFMEANIVLRARVRELEEFLHDVIAASSSVPIRILRRAAALQEKPEIPHAEGYPSDTVGYKEPWSKN